MKKYFTFLVFTLISSQVSFPQEWAWSNSLSSSGEVYPSAAIMIGLVTDQDNNVYQTGFYDSQPLTIGNDTTLPNIGNWDGFICKYNENGKLQWARSMAGINRDQVVAIQIIDNYIFVLGAFKNDDIYFTPTSFLTNYDHYDIFLAKYDLNGNFIKSTRIFWGTNSDRPRDMLYDNVSKQLVIIGNFKDDINYEDEFAATITVNTESIDGKDLFVAKLDTSGYVTNFKSWQLSNSNSVLRGIDWGNDTSYYVSGELTGALYFDTNDSIKGDLVKSDAMIFKLDDNLDKIWAIKGGGSGYDHTSSSVSDIYGNIYICGIVEGSVTFDKNPDGDQSDPTVGYGLQDMFLAKYNSSGSMQWLKTKGSIGDDIAFGLSYNENIVQFCGNFADTVIFNNDTLTTVNGNDLNTSFAIFDLDGNEIGAQSISGDSTELGLEIIFSKDGSTIITGYSLSDPLTIGDSVYANTSSTRNGFIASYKYPFKSFFSKSTPITCPGGSNGELVVSTYYGVGPYSYDWSSPDTNTIENNGSTAFNLSAGSYMVTVTDSKGQIASTNYYVLDDPEDIIITTDSTNLSCFESEDGTISTSVTGGTAPHSYVWSGPSGNNPTAKDQTNLTVGEYQLEVTDNEGCIARDTVIITQPTQITFGNVVVVPDDITKGSIDLDVNGGTGIYTYAWVYNLTDSLVGRVNDTLLNLDAGDYKAYAIDNSLCQADTFITVPSALLRVDLVGTDITCYNNEDGAAYAAIISGRKSFPFVYTFEDEYNNPINPVSDSIIQNLTPGKYFVTATEQGGENRIALDSIIINQPDSLTLSFDSDSVLCYGASNGIITLTVSGGNGSNTYLWSNGSNSKNLTNVSTGWYSVTVTDSKYCEATDSSLVEEPDSLIVNIDIDKSITCYGFSSGRLIANVTGGTPSYSFLWDDPGNQTNKTATNLFSGNFIVEVTDINGCSNSASQELTDPLPLTFASVDTNNITCLNANDGSISVTMAGGTSPYTYSWNQAGLGNNNNIEGLFPVFYALIVSDANGCKNDSLSFQVKSPASQLSVAEVIDQHTNNLCFGDNRGQIAVEASGGWGGYEFSRDQIDWQPDSIFTNLLASTYTISVRDSFGCIINLNLEITEPSELSISISSIENIIEAEGNGGTPPYLFSINNGAWQETSIFTELARGSYSVEIIDANGCGPISDNVLLTDVEEINTNKFLDIYPNPSSGIFNLSFNLETDTELVIEIFSVTGSKVFSNIDLLPAGNDNILELDLGSQEPGVYLLQINGVVHDTKLIIE